MKKLFTLYLLLAFFYTNAQDVPDYVSTTNLIAFYPFDGNFNDYSGNNYNGVGTDIAQDEDRNGNPQSSYYFNTSSSQIIVTNFDAQFGDEISIAFWIKHENGTAILNRRVDGNNSQIDFDLSLNSSTNEIAWHLGNWSAYGPALQNEWMHIAMTFDGSTVKYYVNGVLFSDHDASGNGPITNDDNELRIGTYSANSNFQGNLDDLAFWNRALTIEEIESLNDCGQVNDPADQVVCNAELIDVVFTTWNTGVSTDFSWSSDLDIGFGTSGSGDINSIAVNNGTNPVVATITVTPTLQEASTTNNKSFSSSPDGSYINVVSSSGSLDLTGPYSIVFWTKLNSYGPQDTGGNGYNHFVNKWDGTNHQYVIANNNNGLYTYNNDFLVQTQTLPQLNQWEFIAFTYSGTNAQMYLNGILVDDSTTTAAVISANQTVNIGGAAVSSSDLQSVDGLMDDIQIWDTVLSETEVQSLMQNPPTGIEANLVGFWNFESDTTTSSFVTDVSGSNNYGQMMDTNGNEIDLPLSSDVPSYVTSCEGPSETFTITVNPDPDGGECILSYDDYTLDSVYLYPNPSSDYINISTDSELEAVLYDFLGKELLRKNVRERIDISFLEKGIYIINLTDGINTSSHKVIKN